MGHRLAPTGPLPAVHSPGGRRVDDAWDPAGTGVVSGVATSIGRSGVVSPVPASPCPSVVRRSQVAQTSPSPGTAPVRSQVEASISGKVTDPSGARSTSVTRRRAAYGIASR